ncbi:unnamed protein product [Mycena citricolor]|uniref:Protein kinase domain-containing protein n=1 Tax=Mycena citricolor TaxID=2018698 RepID=A0AAD2Q6G6_9AGAR|nr:unnamed protein product [Mycena citricolor]
MMRTFLKQVFRVLPLEVMLLRAIDHDNIVKCVEVFEDPVYYYLVQELHGSPWHKAVRNGPTSLVKSSVCVLSSSVSVDCMAKPQGFSADGRQLHQSAEDVHLKRKTPASRPALSVPRKPEYSRRPSYDLFECIEQSEHKRLPECQARFVLAQVVEAAYYLDIHGVTHRDIKDENLVIDRNLKVKLIDFGSAVVEDPETRPYHTLFFGTTAYASSEILLKKPYQAPPAEVWTVGVLLSFLLTGSSPFPTVKDAIDGRIVLSDCPKDVSAGALDLMRLCLDPNPKTRATIGEVRIHPWLNSH